MAASLRAVCGALGLESRVSLCGDVFGFAEGRVPAAVVATRPRPSIGLTRWVRLLRDRHVHLHLIIAGADLLTQNDRDTIDYALFRMRDIYAAAGFGVGRVTRDPRQASASAGHATVTTGDGITAAGTDLTVDGDVVPVVVPANMNVSTMNPDGSVTVTLGRSPTPGPCSPRTGSGMRSCVVDISGEVMARTLAHEVGHYLGAEHPAGAPGTNLMAQTGSVADPFNAVIIDGGDLVTMRNHCMVRPGLQGV